MDERPKLDAQLALACMLFLPPSMRSSRIVAMLTEAMRNPELAHELKTHPRQVFERRCGQVIPSDISIEVHLSTADSIHLVLPLASVSAHPEETKVEITDEDLDHMASEFSRAGFRGGLNWYRNIDRNWELTAPWAGATIRQPALFIAGSVDPIIALGSGASALQALPVAVPGLTRTLLIDGAGHFIQQERPQIVNEALVDFLCSLPAWGV